MRIQVLECDCCSSREGVVTLDGKRDGIPFVGDLCQDCWDDLVEKFGIRPGQRSARKKFEVLDDVSQIPSKKPRKGP